MDYFIFVLFSLFCCCALSLSIRYISQVYYHQKKKKVRKTHYKSNKRNTNSEYVLKTTGTGINHCQITFVE